MLLPGHKCAYIEKKIFFLSFMHLPVKELFPEVYENIYLFQEIMLIYFKLYLRAIEHQDQGKAAESIRSLTGVTEERTKCDCRH